MRDIAVKADNVGDVLSALTFNANTAELENAVTATGQSLDPEGGPDTDLNMFGKALATYGSSSEGYTDSGSANAYSLSRASTLQGPAVYKDGMRVTFVPANSNTTTCTINVSGIGVKSLVGSDGEVLVSGDIIADTVLTAVYIAGDDEFRIIEDNVQNSDGNENLLINPSFDFTQYGVTQSTDGYGSFDRWRLNLSGATGTLSQQSFSLGQTDVPGEPEHYLRLNVTGADDNAGVFQYIEDVRTLAGQTGTLSIWAKSDASRTLRFQTKQHFGTGGSPSSDVQTNQQDFTLTTSWQKFTKTVSIASISGKTLGTNNNDYLGILLVNPNNETFTIDIANVKFEAGRKATPFTKRNPQKELSLCQRFYQKSYKQDVNPGTSGQQNLGNPNVIAGSTTFLASSIRFPVVMRATPTYIIYSPSAGNPGKVESVTEVEQTGNVSTVEIDAAGIGLITYDTASFTKGDIYQFHYIVNAEL